MLNNLDKIDKSFNININDVRKVDKFISDYIKENDLVALISNVTNGDDSIFYITNSFTSVKLNLEEVDNFLLEGNCEYTEEFIIHLQDRADVMILDKLIRKRFKSELPFAGFKVIFVNTYLDDYFSEKENDKIELISTEV